MPESVHVNTSGRHLTVPDGCGGALILPHGFAAVPGEDGPLIAVPLGAAVPPGPPVADPVEPTTRPRRGRQ